MHYNCKKVKLSVPAILIVFVISGCATLFKGPPDPVHMRSNPPAKVYINGTYRGKTPLKIQLDPENTYTIEFRKEGYRPKTVYIDNEVGTTWVVLDIVGGFIPVIVDAATGAWYELERHRVNVTLTENGLKQPAK